VGERRFTEGVSGQHPGEFTDAGVPVELPDTGQGPPLVKLLLNLEMGIGPCGDPGEMCDDKHLVTSGKLGKEIREKRGGPAAETGIHLVKEQTQTAAGTPFSQGGANGEMETGEFSSRSDPAHRAQFFPGIGGKKQLCLLDAVAVKGHVLSAALQRAGRIRTARPSEFDPAALHAKSVENPDQLSGQFPPRLFAGFLQFPSALVVCSEAAAHDFPGLPEAFLDSLKTFFLEHKAIPVIEDLLEAA